MKQSDIERIILRTLYEAFFFSLEGVTAHKIHAEIEVDEITFGNVVERMKYQGLIQPGMTDGNQIYYIITPRGILRAEEQDIPAEELMNRNHHVRAAVLDTLARWYEQKGALEVVHQETLVQEINTDVEVLKPNLTVLLAMGYIRPVHSPTGPSYIITPPGFDAIEIWRERNEIIREFENMVNLKPQPRGRKFQELFARVIEQSGWLQKESVSTSNEEMDVIVYKEREYYLVECKWEQHRVQAKIVRELYGKLSKRDDMKGIVVSMSRFTAGAIEDAQTFISSKMILLFGPEDVHSMIYGRLSFDELLNKKHQKAITNREIVFD